MTITQDFLSKLVDYNTTNELANEFARSGNEIVFNKLFYEMKDLIDYLVSSYHYKAINYGLSIPKEDFESEFNYNLWLAAKNFDGSTNIVQRFYFFVRKRGCPNVWRQYQNKGGNDDKDKIRYDKARNDSLDRPVMEDKTLGDIVLGETSFEEDLIKSDVVKQALAEFKSDYERYYIIIQAIIEDKTNEEIASALGENTYNEKVRKLVSRAKKTFKTYINEQLNS